MLLALGLSLSATTFAQEGQVKLEGDDTELKIKDDKLKYKSDDAKIKIKGDVPAQGWVPVDEPTVVQRESSDYKQGQSTTVVRPAKMVAKAAPKKVAAKKCNCPKTAARKPVARKVAYKPKPRARVVAAPAVLHDTVYITRVDTVFRMSEQNIYTGYRYSDGLNDDFEKLKVKKDDDEIKIEKKYKDGRKVEMKFENEEDYNTYMKWKNY
jgi:hypothetical protein